MKKEMINPKYWADIALNTNILEKLQQKYNMSDSQKAAMIQAAREYVARIESIIKSE